MRQIPWILAEPYRVNNPIAKAYFGDDFGAFLIPFKKTGQKLSVIVSGSTQEIPWEHVSVSLPNRCPNWFEMDFIKDIFWKETECVMQLHVPKSDHKCLHPYCLHLWRPVLVKIPRPDTILVGTEIPG